MSGLRQFVKRIVSRIAVPVYRFAVRESRAREQEEVLRQLRRTAEQLEIVYPWDIRGIEHVHIGDHVFIGPEVLMIAERGAEIRIGDKVMFGPRVRVMAYDHRTDEPGRPIQESGYAKFEPIVIGDDVWIGAGATILHGVHVGKGTVVGAGAVLTRSTGEHELWAGNPACKIKDRFAGRETDKPRLGPG